MSVEFTDNTEKIKAALSEGVIGFLHEAGGEIQAQTPLFVRYQPGCFFGSVPVFHRLHGDGRKGGWVYKSKKDGNAALIFAVLSVNSTDILLTPYKS